MLREEEKEQVLSQLHVTFSPKEQLTGRARGEASSKRALHLLLSLSFRHGTNQNDSKLLLLLLLLLLRLLRDRSAIRASAHSGPGLAGSVTFALSPWMSCKGGLSKARGQKTARRRGPACWLHLDGTQSANQSIWRALSGLKVAGRLAGLLRVVCYAPR